MTALKNLNAAVDMARGARKVPSSNAIGQPTNTFVTVLASQNEWSVAGYGVSESFAQAIDAGMYIITFGVTFGSSTSYSRKAVLSRYNSSNTFLENIAAAEGPMSHTDAYGQITGCTTVYLNQNDRVYLQCCQFGPSGSFTIVAPDVYSNTHLAIHKVMQ